MGLRLPNLGIGTTNGFAFYIKTRSLIKSIVCLNELIGFFPSAPELVFDFSNGPTTACFALSFSLSNAITCSDSVKLFLPHFMGNFSERYITLNNSSILNVSWNQNESALVFFPDCQMDLKKSELINVSFCGLPLNLPKEGIRSNSSAQLIVQSLIFPSISAEVRLPAIGSFTVFAIEFLQRANAGSYDVSILFQFLMDLAKGDQIYITMKDFEFESQCLGVWSTDIETFFFVEWDSTLKVLTIPVHNFVPKHQEVRILISGFGMQLPYHHVNATYEGFEMRATCNSGNVIPTQITNFTRIGMLQSSLDFPILENDRRVFYQFKFDSSVESNATSSMEVLSMSVEILSNVNVSDFLDIDISNLGLNHSDVEEIKFLPNDKVVFFKFQRKTQTVTLKATSALFPFDIISMQIIFNNSQPKNLKIANGNSTQLLFMGAYTSSALAEPPILCNHENSIRVSQIQLSNSNPENNYSLLYVLAHVNLTSGDIVDLPFPSEYVSLDCGATFSVQVYGSGNFSILPITAKGILSVRTEQTLKTEFLTLQFFSSGLQFALANVKHSLIERSVQSNDVLARILNLQTVYMKNYSMLVNTFEKMQTLDMKFTGTMKIDKSETVIVSLAGFEGDDFACIPVLSSPSSKVAFASWRMETQQL
eukprot:763983-Hanusia_phi.AAC.1